MGCKHSKSLGSNPKKDKKSPSDLSSPTASLSTNLSNTTLPSSDFNTEDLYINNQSNDNALNNENLPITNSEQNLDASLTTYSLSKEDYNSLYKYEQNIYKHFQLKRINYHNQIKSESIINKYNEFTLPDISKTPTEALLLFKILTNHYLFSFFTHDYLSELVSCFNYVKVNKHEKVIKNNTKNKNFYIVFSGIFYKSKEPIANLNALSNNISKLNSKRLFKSSTFFNDYSLLYDTNCNYDMICLEEGILFYIDSLTYHYLSSQCSRVYNDEIYKILSKIPLFNENYRTSDQSSPDSKYQPTPEEYHLVLNEISKWVEVFPYSTGDVISKGGTPAAAFYIIKEGTVSVTPTSRSLNNIYPHQSLINSCSGSYFSNGIMFSEQFLRAGSYFGERSLMSGELRDSDYVATTQVKLLVLDKYFFDIFFNNKSYISNSNSSNTENTYVNLPKHLYSWLHNQLQYHLGLKLLNSLKWLDFPLIPINNKKIIQREVKLKEYNRGDVILKITSLNDLGKLFFIIIRGKAQVVLNSQPSQSINQSINSNTIINSPTSQSIQNPSSIKSKYPSIMRSSTLLGLNKNFSYAPTTTNVNREILSTKVEEFSIKDVLPVNVALSSLAQPQSNLILGILEAGQYLGHQIFLSPSIFENKQMDFHIDIVSISDSCVCFQFDQKVYSSIFSPLVDIKIAYPDFSHLTHSNGKQNFLTSSIFDSINTNDNAKNNLTKSSSSPSLINLA